MQAEILNIFFEMLYFSVTSKLLIAVHKNHNFSMGFLIAVNK